MSYAFPPELDRLVRDKLASGDYGSEDELLLEAMRALIDRDEAIAGLQQGVRDMEAGRVRPLSEVDAHLRRKYGMSPEA